MEPYSALAVMEGGRRLAATGAHRGREHPDCDARLLGVLLTAVARLLCKHRDGPKWGGGTAGDLQKGENAARSQNLQSSKASLFF